MHHTDESVEYELFGYVSNSRLGFALPCFRRPKGSNTYYVATSNRPGDRRSKILAFNPLFLEEVIELPPELHRRATISSPWLDVLVLNEGGLVVGTYTEIWNAVRRGFSSLLNSRPLTAFDIALYSSKNNTHLAAKKSYDFISRCFDKSKAEKWKHCVALTRLAQNDTRVLLLERKLSFHENSIRKIRVSESEESPLKLPKSISSLIPDFKPSLLEHYFDLDGLFSEKKPKKVINNVSKKRTSGRIQVHHDVTDRWNITHKAKKMELGGEVINVTRKRLGQSIDKLLNGQWKATIAFDRENIIYICKITVLSAHVGQIIVSATGSDLMLSYSRANKKVIAKLHSKMGQMKKY